MNSVTLMGRFTRDPEARQTQSGKTVARFTLAISRYGENKEADFFDCTAWEKNAENILKSCKKGDRLLVWGRLQQEKWTDQQGQARNSIKVIVSGFNFIEPAPEQNQVQQYQPAPPMQQYQQVPPMPAPPVQQYQQAPPMPGQFMQQYKGEQPIQQQNSGFFGSPEDIPSDFPF